MEIKDSEDFQKKLILMKRSMEELKKKMKEDDSEYGVLSKKDSVSFFNNEKNNNTESFDEKPLSQTICKESTMNNFISSILKTKKEDKNINFKTEKIINYDLEVLSSFLKKTLSSEETDQLFLKIATEELNKKIEEFLKSFLIKKEEILMNYAINYIKKICDEKNSNKEIESHIYENIKKEFENISIFDIVKDRVINILDKELKENEMLYKIISLVEEEIRNQPIKLLIKDVIKDIIQSEKKKNFLSEK
jgi:hypothetical protein